MLSESKRTASKQRCLKRCEYLVYKDCVADRNVGQSVASVAMDSNASTTTID